MRVDFLPKDIKAFADKLIEEVTEKRWKKPKTALDVSAMVKHSPLLQAYADTATQRGGLKKDPRPSLVLYSEAIKLLNLRRSAQQPIEAVAEPVAV